MVVKAGANSAQLLISGVWLQDLLLLSQKGGGNVTAELMEVQRKAKANGAVNHYKVLGIHPTALLADVKAAYRSVCYMFMLAS